MYRFGFFWLCVFSIVGWFDVNMKIRGKGSRCVPTERRSGNFFMKRRYSPEKIVGEIAKSM
jgi:hypothetical protein